MRIWRRFNAKCDVRVSQASSCKLSRRFCSCGRILMGLPSISDVNPLSHPVPRRGPLAVPALTAQLPVASPETNSAPTVFPSSLHTPTASCRLCRLRIRLRGRERHSVHVPCTQRWVPGQVAEKKVHHRLSFTDLPDFLLLFLYSVSSRV